MWMSVRCRRVRTVLVWTHLAVFCALVRKDPNLTSLVLVAWVSLFWTKRAGPFGWNQLLFHFKDYYFLSHYHDVNLELTQALIKTIADPPMGKKFEQFSICSPVQIRSACFSFRKVSLLPERLPRWGETLIRRPRTNSYVCNLSFFVWLKKMRQLHEKNVIKGTFWSLYLFRST